MLSQQQIIKLSALSILFVAFSVVSPKKVEASFIPDVHVQVINTVTNAPVTFQVWVNQKNNSSSNRGWSNYLNNCDGTASTATQTGRYQLTDSLGQVTFASAENIPQSACNQPIDSNKDGTNDTVSFPCTTGVSRDGSGAACQAYAEWSCYGNPFSYSVVKPAGDNGTYTTISNSNMPNNAADMYYTIYYTPAGATPAPTPTPNVSSQSSKKEIGIIDNIGKFIPASQVEVGKEYWVRIQMFYANRTASSRVQLREFVNSTYFSLITPYYSYSPTFGGPSDGTGTTFGVFGLVAHGPSTDFENTTQTECNQGPSDAFPSCIKNYNNGGSSFTATPTDYMNSTFATDKYIYFKVKAIAESGGVAVPVDVDDTAVFPSHNGSYIDFIDLPDSKANEPPVTNTQVIVCPVGGCVTAATNGYFQVQKGDTYSNASGSESIKSLLPANTSFAPDNSSIVLHSGSGANFGLGNSNPNNWYLKNYFVDNNLGYDKLYSDYASKIVTKSINGVNGFNATGYYIDTSSQSSSDHNYVLKGANWTNQLSGKQVVFFVPGDLYIESNTDVASNNGSSIIYVVKGNVGFDPAVTKFEGIVIADGSVDTACSSSIKFSGNTCSSGSASVANALTVEGMVYASGGFTLDRKAASGTSESFIGRPDFLLSTISTFGKNVYSWKEYAN